MTHPIIGSHPSLRDQAHLWHFQRTSGLPHGTFTEEHRGLTTMLVFLVGVLAGIISGLIVEWLL